MKKLLIVVLLVQGSALAQVANSQIPLKEAIKDFPRSELQLKTNGPVSIDIDRGARAGYEALAEIAGLNIRFDPDFRNNLSAAFRIENEDILHAFDLLSMRTGSFVEVLDSKTIIVSPDNQTKRRDHELQVLKTFYLPNPTTPQRITEIITALRTTLNVRYIAQSTVAKAIVIRDTPNRIALAEKTIALAGPIVAGIPVATKGEVISGGGHILTLEAGVVHESSPARSALQPNTAGLVSFDMNENLRASF